MHATRHLVSAVLFLAVLGCAHEEKQVQAAPPPPAPPIVAKAEPPPPDATLAEKEDAAALRQLLTGPVAYFDFDRANLTSEDQEKLRALAQQLKEHPTAHLRIAGNTDEVGTEEYNLALGQRRADVARLYLVSLGISTSRIDTISYGDNRPADPGHDAAAHAKNRRDEAEPLSSR
jgi:peptidoglycan-associated lipoprotein